MTIKETPACTSAPGDVLSLGSCCHRNCTTGPVERRRR